MLPILMAAVQQAEEAAERRHLSAAERQLHQAQMLAAMQAQLEAHLARAELRSLKARAAVAAAAATSGSADVSGPIAAPDPPSSPASRSPTSPTAALLQIPLGDLHVESKPVGSGGFGEVFKAQWSTRHMTVAVKKLRVAAMAAADIADFNREVAFLHALPFHEHVLQLHGVAVDEAAGAYWMVMGWMEGGSVHGLLSASRSDPVSLPLSRRL